jgi:hypothetical protein
MQCHVYLFMRGAQDLRMPVSAIVLRTGVTGMVLRVNGNRHKR